MKHEFVLEIDAMEFDRFQQVCQYAGLLDVEIRATEDFIEEEAIITKKKRIVLYGTATDIFRIGRFFERIGNQTTEKAMRFKKSGKVKFPIQLVKFCQLLEIAPEDIAQSFINDFSLSVHGSGGSDERMMAVDYFLRGYSSNFFEHEELGEMLADLDMIRRSWMGNQKEEEYAAWFKTALKEWFEGWKKVKELNIKSQQS